MRMSWRLFGRHPRRTGVAYASIFDLDQNFVWAWSWDVDLLIFVRSASLLEDLRPLFLGDVWGRHAEVSGNSRIQRIGSVEC